MKKIIYLLIFIGTLNCFSIKSQTEEYRVINDYFQNSQDINLVKENFFNGNILKYFGVYEKWRLAAEKTDSLGISLNGKVEWIFSEEDIKYMKNKYHHWKKDDIWDKTKIKKGINLIDSKPDSYGMSLSTRIGYPFFNRTKTKAMLIIGKTKAPLNSGINIVLMKKENGKWEQVGVLFYSIS